MHGFRDNDVVLLAGYDVIVNPPPGDHDFLIAFHSDFSSGMHGFPDNEVLLLIGNDVIVIFSLGGVSHRFC